MGGGEEVVGARGGVRYVVRFDGVHCPFRVAAFAAYLAATTGPARRVLATRCYAFNKRPQEDLVSCVPAPDLTWRHPTPTSVLENEGPCI